MVRAPEWVATRTETATMLEIALALASLGYCVFPLWPDGKNPLIGKAGGGSGFKDATTDPDQIGAWWTRTPRANIGIAAGLSGLVIPDLDVKNGDDGPGNYSQLLVERGLDPADLDPVVVTTASGGFHHYYRGTPIPDRTKIRVGVDLRSDGGYVVAPGSVVNGRTYTGTLPAVEDLPVVPEALRELLVQEQGRDGGGARVSADGRESLAELLQFPESEGGRNDWLAKVAGHYAKSALKFEDYADHVDRANQLCTPPQSDEDVAGVVDSIWRREREKADPESDAYRRQVQSEALRLRVQRDAKRVLEEEALAGQDRGSARTGGSFVFDRPEGTPAVWGTGDQVIWAEGEAMMLVGPPGVGKTTLTGQVVRARLGLGSGEVLGLPVTPTKSKVLYLAMDRPQQIARSLYRHFEQSERETMDEKLVIWEGPPPVDFTAHPEALYDMALQHDADTIIVDSLKDAILGLTDDLKVASYNRARQYAIARGVVILELHHLKKAGADGGKPNDLMGVYGSIWLTGGAGSVYLLWGEAGDDVVEFVGLKPSSAGYVGPWNVRFDHKAGVTHRERAIDPVSLLESAGTAGMTVTQFALARFGDSERATREKARRVLESLAKEEKAVKGTTGEGKSEIVTYLAGVAW